MSEVKGQGHILYPVSNWCTSFSFHINWTNHSWDMAKIVFDLEKTHLKFLSRTFPKFNQVITMTRAIKLSTMFCSDRMSGSQFIMQRSKFLLVDATAVTSSQTHRKVIQYILPDLYILCPKYLRFSSNGFDVRGKSHCGSRRGRPGWLNNG